MKITYISSIAILLFVFAMSCSKDEGPVYTGPGTNATDTISFATDVQPIFDSYCVGCHNQSHSKLNLLTCCSYDQLLFTGFSASYADTVNPASSKLYQYLIGNPTTMPPSGSIPQSEIEKVLQWIEQGAKNN